MVGCVNVFVAIFTPASHWVSVCYLHLSRLVLWCVPCMPPHFMSVRKLPLKKNSSHFREKVDFGTSDLWDRSYGRAAVFACALYELILFVLWMQEGPVACQRCLLSIKAVCVHERARVCVCVPIRRRRECRWVQKRGLTDLCRQVADTHSCHHTIWCTVPVCLFNDTVRERNREKGNNCIASSALLELN